MAVWPEGTVIASFGVEAKSKELSGLKQKEENSLHPSSERTFALNHKSGSKDMY